MKKNKAEQGKKRTTIHTWGRVAMDQMKRMGEGMGRTSELHKASMDHGRELMEYNLKLAAEWQAYMIENSRKLADRFFTPRKS